MSRSHIRVRQQKPASKWDLPRLILVTAALVAIAVLMFMTWLGVFQHGFVPGASETARAEVLETRIASVGNVETGHGGYILYRIETHVRYSTNGESRDRWVPASSPTTDRISLQLQLVDRPTRCLVYWSRGQEDNARCNLDPASK